MILPKNNQKSYGVLHTENYFSFTGFCKKVNSDEIQSVDIYLDDVLIDTILADKKLQKIEDIYDIEGFGFTYDLANEYIGQKNLISFKNHESQENLLNSPYSLVDAAHPKFNEMAFLNSLESHIKEERITELYCPNSIGFLATEENLEDEEFVNYLNQIMKDFPNYKYKALTFNTILDTRTENLFDCNNLEYIQIASIYDIFKNLEVYLSNYEKTYSNILENGIVKNLRNYSTDVFCIGLGLNQKSLTIKQQELNNPIYFDKFFNNLEYLGFDKEDIAKYGNSFHEVYFKKASEKYSVDIDFNLDESISKAYVYWNLKIGLSNHEFFQESLIFAKKFAKLQ